MWDEAVGLYDLSQIDAMVGRLRAQHPGCDPLSRNGPMTTQLEQSTLHDISTLARRLEQLHQLIYARGGVKPSNAAVEELSKLLLIRIAAFRYPESSVDGFGDFDSVADLLLEGRHETVDAAKAAFKAANLLPGLGARLPDGEVQPIWPRDEPLRISRIDVICEAARLLWALGLGRVGSYDPVGTAFDVFLRGKYENAGGLGTYLTPETVVDLMVSVGLALRLNDRTEGPLLMGDPCCGTGRFLVALLHELRDRHVVTQDSELASLLFGADQSTSSVAMACVNLMAAGLEGPEVFAVEDSITDDHVSTLRGKLALILTNPPFGDKKYDSPEGITVASQVIPHLGGNGRIDPALAFVARCIDLLAPGGVAGIILPDGVLDGPAMRALLLGQARLDLQLRLEGVVSLPPATFAPAGTTAKTSVLFLRKASGARESRVFMARTDHVGYIMRKGAIAEDPAGNDLPTVAETIVRYIRADDTETDSPVTFPRQAELTSLDASSFDSRAGEARLALNELGGAECREFLEYCGKRREPVTEGVPFVSVLHVDELGNIDWAQAKEYRPSTPGQVAKPGEVLVSLLNPAKFRVAVIPNDVGAVQCSAEFGVFKSSINPYAALALLQHPDVRAQAAPLGRGTSSSRRRIEPDDVLSLVTPPVDSSWEQVVGKMTADAIGQVSEGRIRLKAIYEQAMGPDLE